MTITLQLTPDEEALLDCLCQAQGIEPVFYIYRLIRHDLERGQWQEKNQVAIALLQSWMDEELPEAEKEQDVQAKWK